MKHRADIIVESLLPPWDRIVRDKAGVWFACAGGVLPGDITWHGAFMFELVIDIFQEYPTPWYESEYIKGAERDKIGSFIPSSEADPFIGQRIMLMGLDREGAKVVNRREVDGMTEFRIRDSDGLRWRRLGCWMPFQEDEA